MAIVCLVSHSDRKRWRVTACELSVSQPRFVGNGNSANRLMYDHMQVCRPFGKVLGGCDIPVVTVSSFPFLVEDTKLSFVHSSLSMPNGHVHFRQRTALVSLVIQNGFDAQYSDLHLRKLDPCVWFLCGTPYFNNLAPGFLALPHIDLSQSVFHIRLRKVVLYMTERLVDENPIGI
jgi:hypothetical protein